MTSARMLCHTCARLYGILKQTRTYISPTKLHPPLMKEILKCDLCPRMCGANRLAGARGYCHAGNQVKIFRWGPHFGEEPPLSGTSGSGAVFFSHCTLGCLYCQNYPWSASGDGDEVGVDGLERVLRDLAEAGCHNWNLVTPGPWLPFIQEAADLVEKDGNSLPFVYNTSGYERVEVVKRYRGLLDVVLTDLRYASAAVAKEGSSAPDYPVFAREFVKWCCEEIGPLVVDGADVARSGVIVRVLVLPGREAEAVANLEWLESNVGTEVAVSLMSQYTPVYMALETEGWNRGVSRDEYSRVVDRLEELGFENGWVQEFGANGSDDALLGCNMERGGAAAVKAES